MTYLLAIAGGIAGAALGWFIAAAVALAAAGALGVSDFEGGRAMQAMWGVGPIGGLIGLVAGAWLVLRYHGGHKHFSAAAGRIALVVLGIGLLTTGALAYLYVTRPVLNTDGPAPRLVFEMRLPPGMAVLREGGGLKVELQTEKNVMPADMSRDVRDESGRTIVAGSVEVYYRSHWRFLVLKTADGIERIFDLKLAASPRHAKDFGPWERVKFIAKPGPAQPVRAKPEDQFDVRYHVVWPGQN